MLSKLCRQNLNLKLQNTHPHAVLFKSTSEEEKKITHRQLGPLRGTSSPFWGL